MPVAEQDRTEEQSNFGGARGAALKAAAAAATAGAATFAVRRAMSHDGSRETRDDDEQDDRETDEPSGERGGRLGSAGATVWSAASDALLPVAEDAAGAFGRYLADHGPEIVRERIVPRFIEAFKDAA